ncbi:conserved hypothetical protein [Desulfurivibrio alkaliphilus AHT 2]|nr:hypothetical protein [Desulfurivibrio alkaliphilus]ADH86302.1 conserved hypothetical protein [Desulfurivibrio alkaliphilus AHT 2]
MRELTELLDELEPKEILQTLLPAVRGALGHLDDEERQQWLARFLGDNGDDKLVGMVNL